MATTFNHKPQHPLGKKVFIATPSFSGGPSAPYVFSLLETIKDCQDANISIEWCLLTENCHVDDSRNYLARNFLESDCDYFFFIDADMGWQAEDFIKSVECEHYLVAGVYPKKSDATDYPVIFPPGPIQADRNGWVEAERAPTGFMCFKRSVIQKLYDSETRTFNSVRENDRLPQAIIFERTYDGNHRISGDYSVCDKWRAMGGKIYTDPEMKFVHEGKKEWSGKLGHYLREKHDLTESFIYNIISRIEAGDYSNKDFIDLFDAYNNKWSAPVELLVSLAAVLEVCEGPILELGSGITTLIIGAIAKRRGLDVVTVEHDKKWHKTVSRHLDNCGLIVDLKHCPIDTGANWYDYKPEKDFKVVLCDGPPRKIGRSGIRSIQDRFLNGCIIIADDFDSGLGIELDNVIFKQHGRFAMGVKEQ